MFFIYTKQRLLVSIMKHQQNASWSFLFKVTGLLTAYCEAVGGKAGYLTKMEATVDIYCVEKYNSLAGSCFSAIISMLPGLWPVSPMSSEVMPLFFSAGENEHFPFVLEQALVLSLNT